MTEISKKKRLIALLIFFFLVGLGGYLFQSYRKSYRKSKANEQYIRNIRQRAVETTIPAYRPSNYLQNVRGRVNHTAIRRRLRPGQPRPYVPVPGKEGTISRGSPDYVPEWTVPVPGKDRVQSVEAVQPASQVSR